jgi:hypothetical protein
VVVDLDTGSLEEVVDLEAQHRAKTELTLNLTKVQVAVVLVEVLLEGVLELRQTVESVDDTTNLLLMVLL